MQLPGDRVGRVFDSVHAADTGHPMNPPMDGKAILQGPTELQRIIASELLLQAADAREDIVDFFNFVMRSEEAPYQLLKAAAHQRLGLRFMLDHRRSVNMWPRDHAKTFSSLALCLKLLGDFPSLRGAVVSSSQELAAKVLRGVSDYIEHSDRLHLVYPNLVKSERSNEPWTQTALTVKRPPGTRDPSLVAIGYQGAVVGRRLDWILIDDLLTQENTTTEDSRMKMLEWVDGTLLGTLVPSGESRVIITNTPWHPQDLLNSARKRGWATLRMTISGDVDIEDDREEFNRISGGDYWDSDELRPSKKHFKISRLAAHDPDPDEKVQLWPERWTSERIAMKRREILEHVYLQNYEMVPLDPAAAWCKPEWIELCKKNARDMGVYSLAERWTGDGVVIMGIDLAIQIGEHNDDTAFFTFVVLPSGHRQILDIDFGKFDGPTNIAKTSDKTTRYNIQLARVENNGCFAPETLVLTETGYVPISKVSVGDRVWTHAQRWRAVTKVHRVEQAPYLTTARCKGGLSVRATPTHWFRMRQAGRARDGRHRPVGYTSWISGGFVEKPSYVAVAAPRWIPADAVIQLPEVLSHRRNTAARRFTVDEQFGLLLGLYMAEGHSTKGQVFWTFAKHEEHLAVHVKEQVSRLSPQAKVTMREGDGTLRVVVSSKALASVFLRFGKSAVKKPPMEWWGWPLPVRLAMVRGWLMGDGCVLLNNQRTKWSGGFFAGTSISRDWMLFARATLLENGLRPSLSKDKPRSKRLPTGRTIVGRSPEYVLRLPAEDSIRLFSMMTHHLELEHWAKTSKRLRADKRRSGGAVVWDEGSPWSRFVRGDIEEGGLVFNLEVEEDESFVVEDMVVHNGQDFFRQWALDKQIALPLEAHTTTSRKSHAEDGIPGLFLEIANGAWLIPNDQHGNVDPRVQRWIDACLKYVPDKHTDDVLMASYFAQQGARKWGLGTAKREAPTGAVFDPMMR